MSQIPTFKVWWGDLEEGMGQMIDRFIITFPRHTVTDQLPISKLHVNFIMRIQVS